MSNLPEFLSNHPFFKTSSFEMSEKAKKYKHNIDNFSKLNRKQQFELFSELLELNFHWPDFLRQEGFWCEEGEQHFLFKNLPFPQENTISITDKKDFLTKLHNVEKKASFFSYMGFSRCRICGQRNGTKTFYSNTFAWPDGYSHYIEEHNIQPSAAFVLHIRGLIS